MRKRHSPPLFCRHRSFLIFYESPGRQHDKLHPVGLIASALPNPSNTINKHGGRKDTDVAARGSIDQRFEQSRHQLEQHPPYPLPSCWNRRKGRLTVSLLQSRASLSDAGLHSWGNAVPGKDCWRKTWSRRCRDEGCVCVDQELVGYS